MVVPPTNMTRSFINPKDRAAEVAKRRQEFEAEMLRRREDRIRQIQERSDNAIKRKQMGIQEKLNKHKIESQHLKEINKRRTEKETQEKQRLQQLLEKKRSPPRTTQTKPKTTVAFGSRVPRHLDLNKSSSSGRSASSSSANGTLNNTTNSLMTRSVHPVMTPLRSNAKPPSVKPTSKPPPKPTNTTRPAPRLTASPRKAPENRMSRSVHPELCPTSNRRFEKAPNKPALAKNTVAKVTTKHVPIKTITRPAAKPTEAPVIQVEEKSVDVKEPEVVKEPEIAEPVIQVEEKAEVVKDSEVAVPTAQIEEKSEVAKESEIADPIIQVEEKLEKDEEPRVEISNIIDLDQLVDEPNAKESSAVELSVETTPRATEFGQLLNFDSNNEEVPEIVPPSDFIHNRSSSDDRDSTRTRTITPQAAFSDDEHDSGVVHETPSPPIETEPTMHNNHMFLLNTKFSTTTENVEEIETPNSAIKTSSDTGTNGAFEQTRVSASMVPADPEQNTSNVKESPSTNGSGALASGVVIGLTEKLQQERDNRRAKLNEILSRTREQSNSSSPVKSESDASLLAKSLLARRSEKLGEPKQSDAPEVPTNNGNEQKAMSLADEFENLGLSTKQEMFLLPGQIHDSHNNGVSG